jgi:hypothetical protein
MSGPEISEAGHEVVTHQERPVVAKPCRLSGSAWGTENVTEDKEVSETVCKEHIEKPDRDMDPGDPER